MCSYYYIINTEINTAEDGGKSKRPAKVVMVATHADLSDGVKKSASGESTSSGADQTMEYVHKQYGHLFDVSPKAFVVDTNAANSQDMKALKAAITQIKTTVVEVKFVFR